MLSHTHVNDDDDQWLYLPALGRVKRISSSNKSGSFMGSEIAFEDFSGNDYRKYEWEFIGEEEYEGEICYKLVSIPKYKNTMNYKFDNHFAFDTILVPNKKVNMFYNTSFLL